MQALIATAFSLLLATATCAQRIVISMALNERTSRMAATADCWGDPLGVFVIVSSPYRFAHTELGVYGTVYVDSYMRSLIDAVPLDASGHARTSFELPAWQFVYSFQGFSARVANGTWRATINFVQCGVYANADASHVLGAWCDSEELVLRVAGRYRPLRVLDVYRNGALFVSHPSNFATVNLRLNVPSIAYTEVRDVNTRLLYLF
jgi:hypothetical protein